MAIEPPHRGRFIGPRRIAFVVMVVVLLAVVISNQRPQKSVVLLPDDATRAQAPVGSQPVADTSTDQKTPEVFTPRKLFRMKSAILSSRNVKNRILPYSLEYRQSKWLRRYMATPTSYLWTQLNMALVGKRPGQTRLTPSMEALKAQGMSGKLPTLEDAISETSEDPGFPLEKAFALLMEQSVGRTTKENMEPWLEAHSELMDKKRSQEEFAKEFPGINAEAILSRWDADPRPFVKEYSLFLLGYLHELTQKTDYLKLLVQESQEIVNELDSLTSIAEHEIARRDRPYPFFRGIAERLAREQNPSPNLRMKLIDFYRQSFKSKAMREMSSINERCDSLWAFVPLLSGKFEIPQDFRDSIGSIHSDFVKTLQSHPENFEGLANVLSCTHAFFDIGTQLKIDPHAVFNLALRHYLLPALNHPQQAGCPSLGGFFSKPIQNGHCQEGKMYLSENVWLTYLLYKSDTDRKEHFHEEMTDSRSAG